MPRDLSPLDELPGLLGDTGVVLRLPGPPPEHIRRLMGTLGVRIEVTTAVSAQDFTATRDCVTPGCPEAAEAGLTHCRRHADVSELRVRRDLPAVAPPEPTVVVRSNPERRREMVVAWILDFHNLNSRVPAQRELAGFTVGEVRALFGSFGDAVEAAGLPRPTRGGKKAAERSRPREPAATKPRKGENPPLPEPEAAPEADVDCNAFPDPPRPLADLVIEWEEARAAAVAAEAAWMALEEQASDAAAAAASHPDFQALEEIADALREP